MQREFRGFRCRGAAAPGAGRALRNDGRGAPQHARGGQPLGQFDVAAHAGAARCHRHLLRCMLCLLSPAAWVPIASAAHGWWVVRSCGRALKRPLTFSFCGAGSARRGRRDAAQCECTAFARAPARRVTCNVHTADVHIQHSHTAASLRHTLRAAGGGEHATLSRIGPRRDADGRSEPCDVPFALGPQGRGPTCVVRWHSCNMCRCVEPARILGLLRLSADAPLVGMWLRSQGLRACPFTHAHAHAVPIWRAIARGRVWLQRRRRSSGGMRCGGSAG